MRRKKRAVTRSCGNNHAPRAVVPGRDKHSLTDYEKGGYMAALAFMGMFVILTIGAVVFGW